MEVFNLDYIQAKPVVLRQWRKLELYLVGCGGTGSWLAPHIARLAAVLLQDGKDVSLTFIDGDTVEAANVPRQNFCWGELGAFKALSLALRYGTAWGIDIGAITKPLRSEHIPLPYSPQTVQIIVGCVDNAAARGTIAEIVRLHNQGASRANNPPGSWWLDCGNTKEGGQVLLGSMADKEELRGAFKPASICRALPAPSLQRPELLEALPEERTDATLSCAQIAVANAQSLTVNCAMAAIAADYLLRLAVVGDLRRFATYIDLPSGVEKSLYTTPSAVATAIGETEAVFEEQEKVKVSA